MTVKTVAILSPGDMGSGVGRALHENGFDVISCLQGRSERTRQLARQAGFRDVPSMEELVTQADLILCILVPAQAAGVAERVADALRATGASTYYADCNAVSPQTTRAIGEIITSAGGRYIDGGIIGGPPGRSAPPRFYVSGPDASVMTALDGKGIDVRPIGDAIGRASGIKMCYAALTKGTSTLQIALLSAAEALGITDELRAEFASSQPNALKQMDNGISRLPRNAHRWIGEMEEIAATFEHAGVTPYFHKGAAEIYRLLSETPFADETPETVDRNRPTSETIKAVVELLRPGVPAGD
jgi:3-hydroxyisobutyrate dehydrogenase-like beta-hydroxyacid dehydrogenase